MGRVVKISACFEERKGKERGVYRLPGEPFWGRWSARSCERLLGTFCMKLDTELATIIIINYFLYLVTFFPMT